MLEKIVGLVSSKNDNEKEGVLKKSVKTLSPPISSLSPKVFIPHPEVFFPIFCREFFWRANNKFSTQTLTHQASELSESTNALRAYFMLVVTQPTANFKAKP